MKTFLSGLVILLLLVGFSSCQKEIDWGLVERPQVDSTIIWKYIEFDTTLPSGVDTISIYTFEYDNSSRLISFKKLDKDNSAPPSMLFPYFRNTTYSYNANDTLPFKVITTYRDFLDNNGNDTTYLFYANGLVIRDSTRSIVFDITGFSFPSISVNHYVVNGNEIVATHYRDLTLNPSSWPPACPGTTIYQQTVLNGNIISETGNFSDCSGIGESYFNATYDNKPNPFYSLRIPYPVLDGVLDIGNVQKNNTLETWGDNSPTDKRFRYSYIYHTNGYPIDVRIYEVSDPSNAWKGKFVYK
jgi:hypothetical protein